jgi:hypothetical protein
MERSSWRKTKADYRIYLYRAIYRAVYRVSPPAEGDRPSRRTARGRNLPRIRKMVIGLSLIARACDFDLSGHGGGDEGGAALAEKSNGTLGCGAQGVHSSGLRANVRYDFRLLVGGRKW